MSVDMFQYSPNIRCYTDGRVERLIRGKYWRVVENKDNSHGYNRVNLTSSKKVQRHRLIAFCFLGLKSVNFEGDFTNDEMVDHIDKNTLNNAVNNLQIVNNAQNQWKSNKKYNLQGDSRNLTKRFRIKISVNGESIDLGYFSTAEEAREAHLQAKAKYHVS